VWFAVIMPLQRERKKKNKKCGKNTLSFGFRSPSHSPRSWFGGLKEKKDACQGGVDFGNRNIVVV